MSFYQWEFKLDAGELGNLDAVLEGCLYGTEYIEAKITGLKVHIGKEWRDWLHHMPKKSRSRLETEFLEKFVHEHLNLAADEYYDLWREGFD